MQKMLSTMFRLVLLAMAPMILFAACGSNDEDSNPTQPPPVAQVNVQPTAISTRIVTITPQGTPFFSAPPAELDISRYDGDWSLQLRYEINGGVWADQMVYSGTAGIVIGSDGSIFGTGNYGFSATDNECLVTPAELQNISFTAIGRFRESDASGGPYIDFTITPTQDVVEKYSKRCVDASTGDWIDPPQEVSGTILWPVMIASDQLHFSFDISEGSAWNIQVAEQPITTGGDILANSTLKGEIYFNR
jgi:hypothetical protein